MAKGLFDDGIDKELRSDVNANVEYVNPENGHKIILTGRTPIFARKSKVEGLVVGFGVKGDPKPANYQLGSRCWINGEEHPVLTDEMILKGEF